MAAMTRQEKADMDGFNMAQVMSQMTALHIRITELEEKLEEKLEVKKKAETTGPKTLLFADRSEQAHSNRMTYILSHLKSGGYPTDKQREDFSAYCALTDIPHSGQPFRKRMVKAYHNFCKVNGQDSVGEAWEEVLEHILTMSK